MKKNNTFSTILDITVVMLIIVATIFGSAFSAKVLKTSFNLWKISDEIAYINEVASRSAPGHEWPDDTVERYDELQNQRSAIYNSEDSTVRWFSTASKFTQLCTLLAVVAMIFSMIFIWIICPAYCVYLKVTRPKKKNRR